MGLLGAFADDVRGEGLEESVQLVLEEVRLGALDVVDGRHPVFGRGETLLQEWKISTQQIVELDVVVLKSPKFRIKKVKENWISALFEPFFKR